MADTGFGGVAGRNLAHDSRDGRLAPIRTADRPMSNLLPQTVIRT
jgi:hypothetical protein